MTNDSAHYTIPREPGRIEAVVLAVLMHALLFTFLWIGINWVSQTPQSIDPDYVVTQQELDVQQPQPEPVPVPTPKVEDRTPPVPDADIATAQEKKRLKQEKEEQEKIAQQKKLDEQRKQEELDKQKAKEEADKKREEEKEKEKEKKLAEKKEQQEEQKKMQKLRDEERARITREAGGNPGTGSPSAPGKPGGNGAWIGKVQAKIKSLIVFNAPPGADQNATAQFAVSLLPDGSVASVKLTSSSGNPAWDDAVKRAIENAAPYPFDSATGSVPRQFTSSNRLGDQK